MRYRAFYAAMVFPLLAIAFAAVAQADILRDMSSQIQYLSQRQKVLATNIANVNTPGFKAKELASPISGSQPLALATTSPMHIAGLGGSLGAAVIDDPEVRTQKLDGNTVELEDQMIKMNRNSMDYKATLSMLGKVNQMMKTAIGEGGR